MSAWVVHYDPTIFSSPEIYNPSRWLGDAGIGLDRFLVPLLKGTRQVWRYQSGVDGALCGPCGYGEEV
jgi:hypothetical protein